MFLGPEHKGNQDQVGPLLRESMFYLVTGDKPTLPPALSHPCRYTLKGHKIRGIGDLSGISFQPKQ